MLRIGADENFNGAIVRGMLRRQRVVLTHDVTTLRQFAYARGFRCQASSKWVTKSPSEKPLRTSC